MSSQQIMNRMAFGLTVFVLFLIGLAVFSVITTKLDLEVTLSAQGIRVQHKGAVLMPAEDRVLDWVIIHKVEALAVKPQLRKINGLDGAVTRIGSFSAEGIGEVKSYIDDLNRQWVLVETSNGNYLFSPKDAENFVSEAERLRSR